MKTLKQQMTLLIDPILPSQKDDGETYHYVTGEVYAPGVVDTDFEAMTPEDVRKLAYRTLRNQLQRNVDTTHDEKVNNCVIVESFIARKGDPDFNEGAWVATVEIAESSDEWKRIKTGELNGFSAQFKALKAPKTFEVTIYQIAVGETELNVESQVDQHKHQYYVEFDENGKVLYGATDQVNGHIHQISGTTATDIENDHGHRFFVGDKR